MRKQNIVIRSWVLDTAKAQRLKVTPGITGWYRPSVHSDGFARPLDVGSSYPGGGEAPKGLAVRQLKRNVSWVQTVARQVGLLSGAGVETCGNSFLVREDRNEHISGVSVVTPVALLSSYCMEGISAESI